MNKDEMKELYRREVEGTKDLYCDVGYSMRMHFWDQINLIFSKQISSQEAYDSVLKLMNDYIENCKDQSSTEHVNTIICDRNRIKKLCPEQFVKCMRSCLEKEDDIWKRHYATAMETDNDNFLNQEWKADGQSVNRVQKSHQGNQMADELQGSLVKVSKDIQELQKSFENEDDHWFSQLQMLLQNLKALKDLYLEHEAQVEVKLSPKNNFLQDLIKIFDKFAKLLTEINKMCPYGGQWEEILKEYFSMIVLIVEHPKGCIQIDNKEQRDKTSDAKGKGRKSTKKDPAKGEEQVKKFCTKPQQFISSKLIFLGYDHLSHFEIKEVLITADSCECACDLIVPDLGEKDKKGPELYFHQIQIKHYKRQKSTYVNQQCCRLLFQLKVSFFGRDWEMKAKSLPFFCYSGSSQLLELTGTRIWYIGSNRGKMYSDCKLHDQLHEDQVFQILDDRIKSIGTAGNRPLSAEDKKFLMDMIPRRKGDDPKMISLNSFVKDKRTGYTDPFFTWFYAFANTLENDLLEHWNQGTIHNLITEEEAKQRLRAMPCKTALIRPARSYVVKHRSLEEARIKLVVNIKVMNGVDSVPMEMDFLKNNHGLCEALKSIQAKNGTIVINALLTNSQSICHLEDLRKDDEENDENLDLTSKDDYTATRKMERLTLQHNEPSEYQETADFFNPQDRSSSKKRKLSPPPATPMLGTPGTPMTDTSNLGSEQNGHSGISSDEETSDDVYNNDADRRWPFTTRSDPFLG